jgi:hypothetical protein
LRAGLVRVRTKESVKSEQVYGVPWGSSNEETGGEKR